MNKRTLIIIIALALAAAAIIFWLAGGPAWIESLALHRTMETDTRLRLLKVDRIVETLDLRPGMKVADLGAGTGLFTWPMARKVSPGGTVYAADINQYLLKDVEDGAKSRSLANIRTVASSPEDPLLPEPVDLIFSCGTFHYIEGQTGYFQTLHRYLKPGGRIAIIDLEKSHPIGSQIHYTPEEQEGWMRDAGFRLLERHRFLEHFYFMVYRKVEQGPRKRPFESSGDKSGF
jgi:arsenite methyltransferase